MKQTSINSLPVSMRTEVARVSMLADKCPSNPSIAADLVRRIESHTGLSSDFGGVILPVTAAPETTGLEPGWDLVSPG